MYLGGDLFDFLSIDSAQDDELVAADSRHHRVRPGGSDEAVGDGGQRVVTRDVPVRVVEDLERVDVDE